MHHIIIFITTANQTEAENISHELVLKNLVACCSIIPDIRSIFFWKGEIHNDQESLIIAKSITAKFKSIDELVRSIHSYETPEIIALPLIYGSEAYLKWIDNETSSS